MKHIHKLPFGVPSGVSALPLSTLENIVVKLYQETMQNENSLIAYKGGCFEKTLLASCGIPSVNLERFAELTFGIIYFCKYMLLVLYKFMR